jgi:hypothetical protein
MLAAGKITSSDAELSNLDALTLERALRRYFEENGFGEDGRYSAAWVDFELGPIPFPFPNTKGRKRAVPFHDLHHLVTGYRTDTLGEFEISAWEIASGCRDFLTAWQINLSGLAAGVLVTPRTIWRAFVRGRHSKNLYDRAYDHVLLSTTVGAARRALGLDVPLPPPTSRDRLLFGLAVAAGVVSGLLFFAAFAPLAVVAWPVLRVLRRAHGEPSAAGSQVLPPAGVRDGA